MPGLILVIEDEPGIVDFLRRGLEAHGFDVVSAPDGLTGTDLAVRLSTTEFELLVYLLSHRGRVLSREQILRAVWGYEHEPGTNLVDVYVGYLRRKLRGPDGGSPIVTVRSVGYRLGDAL